jgi:hypothetical protein
MVEVQQQQSDLRTFAQGSLLLTIKRFIKRAPVRQLGQAISACQYRDDSLVCFAGGRIAHYSCVELNLYKRPILLLHLHSGAFGLDAWSERSLRW